MNILRALFLNNSNKENATIEPTKATTDQSIEFMSKFNLRILRWELRINYHKNQQTGSALPLPIQKWLKQQQEQYPHADWVMDRVEKSILDEIKDTPAAAIREIVGKGADQRKRRQPPAPATTAAVPAQAQVPVNVDPSNCRLRISSACASPAGSSYPLAHNEKNAFHNFDNLPFNKRQILRVFGMEDNASASGSGPSFEERDIAPSNGFSSMPRDWDEVVIAEEENDAPVPCNAATRLIAPLEQTGAPAPVATAAVASAAAMVRPQTQGAVVAPAHLQNVADNDHHPTQLVNNNNDNIWKPLHGIPGGQPRQQYTPLIYTPCIPQLQQPRQEPFPGPTGEGFCVTGGHPPQQLQPCAPLQQLHYQQQQGQYEHALWYHQPVNANHAHPEIEEQMRNHFEKFYNNYYKKYYDKQLKDYILQQKQLQQQVRYQQAQHQPRQAQLQQQQQQQQQLPAPQRPQPLVEQQQRQEEEEIQGDTAYVSAQVIDMGGAEYANVSIHQVDRLRSDWHAHYSKEFGDFCNDLMPRLGNRFVFGASSAKLECINTIGNGVNGDIHIVKYFEEPPAPAPKPIQYVMKKVKFANYIQCKETHVIGKKMALHLGAEEEVFGLTLDHPNLMKLYQVFLNNDDLNLEIIMPRMTASLSKLSTVLRQEGAFPYHEKTAWYIMHEFLQGLAFLHANGRFHGDIKPANVLVSETGEIKLTDFGLCGRTDEVCHHLRGTPLYLAPEVAATEIDSNAKYGYKSDMYSTGIMMYELLMGDPASEGCPFDYEGHQLEDGWKWLATRNPVITSENVSPFYKSLLASLLCHDPHERPSAINLMEDMEYFTYFRYVHNREAEKLEFSKLIRIYTSFEVVNQV